MAITRSSTVTGRYAAGRQRDKPATGEHRVRHHCRDTGGERPGVVWQWRIEPGHRGHISGVVPMTGPSSSGDAGLRRQVQCSGCCGPPAGCPSPRWTVLNDREHQPPPRHVGLQLAPRLPPPVVRRWCGSMRDHRPAVRDIAFMRCWQCCRTRWTTSQPGV